MRKKLTLKESMLSKLEDARTIIEGINNHNYKTYLNTEELLPKLIVEVVTKEDIEDSTNNRNVTLEIKPIQDSYLIESKVRVKTQETLKELYKNTNIVVEERKDKDKDKEYYKLVRLSLKRKLESGLEEVVGYIGRVEN